MSHRLKMINRLLCAALLAVVFVQVPALAKSEAASASASRHDKQRYIVILDDLPLAAYDGRVMATPERDKETTQLAPTAIRFTGAARLDVNSEASKQYLQHLDERFKSFSGEALLRLGHQLRPVFRYRNASNGFAADLTAAEARTLLQMPAVTLVELDQLQRIHTDSGPTWIGADKIHNGSVGHVANGGENTVIGMFDLGINWDHLSFQDPGETGTGWNHVNPYGTQLGLCSDPEVLCNDKLVGVYDFIEDDPNTEVEEENTKGKDNDGHGSHTSSTAAGNPVTVTTNGQTTVIAGVAPNANIVAYRVCYVGDPADPDDDACPNSASLKAMDQAITDHVDVINYSLGGDFHDPWLPNSTSSAFLNVRAAGIFVAASAGNSGPNGSTVGTPSVSPWVTSVGNATHDRVYASALENLSGGNTTVPDDLIGASFTTGIGVRKIVHAKDFGNALCGTGPSTSQIDCVGSSSASNPFAAGTFNGEIVVCDRGDYARVEKGKNVMLAGAGGYVLANTAAQGEGVVADNHCLPATHIGVSAGDELRAWLDSGSNHQGSLSGFSIFHIPEAGDIIARRSSRGPNQSPLQDVMKPDVIAPGTQILAAWSVGTSSTNTINGTSMSSPHVAGGAALLKAVHPDWSPAVIASVLVMTATPDQAIDFDDSGATVHKQGGGRVRLDQAVNAALYLNETENGFRAADPDLGGDPKDLNLPGLIDSDCVNKCSFRRTVTDLAGGASWTASAEGLPDGISVTISPSNFGLANGASRLLTIDVDLTGSELLHNWIYAKVRLKSTGHPDAVFPLAVFYAPGSLPSSWTIDTDEISGWKEFGLSDLANMPDATYTSGGLVIPTRTSENLPQDPTPDLVYDNDVGVMTVWHTVTAGTLLLHTETLDSTAVDLDLFVGLDANGDGIAQESEELCSSTTPVAIELCQLFNPVAGDYWVRVQNWEATEDPDEAILLSGVVGKDTSSPLTATGNGIILPGDSFNVRLSWDNVNAVPGTQLLGAVGVGTHRDSPNNLGIVPVTFTKTAVANAETLVLMNGVSRGLSLAANGAHEQVFIDVPPGSETLIVAASGANDAQSNSLAIELYRVEFDAAFDNAPFVTAVDTSGSPLASASGGNGNGPSLTVSGSSLTPGRWFVVLKNSRGEAAAVDVQADLTFGGTPVPLRSGLWQAPAGQQENQGFDYSSTGSHRAFLWYTYSEDGVPVWYLAAAPEPDGNVWVAELLRFTNNGTLQQDTPVGHVSITLLDEEDSIFSFVLFGEQGSNRVFPSLPPTCPTISGSERSYNGTWSRAAAGVGGATVVVNATSQAFVHYIYDDLGKPVWMIGVPETQGPTEEESILYQFGGYCAVCDSSELPIEAMGAFTRQFASEDELSWNLNYTLIQPLSGSINRTDAVVGKLTAPIACQ